ncbi:MAG: non-ribosomal peptide synthetase [Chloroflexi bacterium]|nr:non-ribosomal peptide synthetase [Chloroflexota bacterium]
MIGGEALSGSNLGFWTNNAPSIRLFNEYGPTETVVGCCVYEVPAGTIVKGPVPIGQPISNVQIYLLDAAMEPVAIGIPGELYIGGDSLARGYLNQPALSAEKFVPHPYSAAVGSRLYRTGDLARFRPDGQLEFLKRLDQQIKLRGFRIELGEIEAALLEHPQVSEVVVVLLGTEPSETRLVAYIVLQNDASVTVNDLRSFLKQKLPEYMVPSAFMLLPHLPLTTNGKVDRQALPAPQGERPELESTYVAPRDDLEQVLTNVWQEHLRITKLGIHDNVFDMGAHSLLVAQVHIHLGELLDTDISMLDLLQYPTVSTLAERMRRNQPESPALQQSTSRAQSRKDAIKRSRRSTTQNRQDDETR